MPFRTWMYVFAIIGLTLPTSGQAQEETQSKQRQSESQEAPSHLFKLPVLVDIIEDDAAAQARKSREEESSRNEIADLKAQQGMNAATQAIKEATLDMRDSAQTSTLLVGIGTGLLIVTLFLTFMANVAAMRAVSVTREIGEAQVRAYVAPYEFSVVLDQNVGIVDIHGVVRNSGQSPAQKFRHGYIVVNEPKDFDISKSKVDTFSPEAVLSSNGATPIHEYITTGGEYDQGWVRRIITKEDCLWVVAEGEYFDVFGKEKHSYRKVIRADVGRSPVVFVVVEDTQKSEKV